MTAAIEAVFARFGGDLVDPPIVMPAALPLELSGEAVRARLCIFTDNHNRDVALRPDLTLPLALDEISKRRAGRTGQQTSRYASRVFRLPASSDDPAEFVQIGCERYGDVSGPEIDAEIYAAVVDASAAGGASAGLSRFGDLAIFDAFVGTLGLQKSVEDTLRRAFREDGGISAVLNGAPGKSNAFAAQLKNVSAADAEALVSEMMDVAGIELVGTRRLEEVVTRLLEQANDGDISAVSDEIRTTLNELVNIDVEMTAAVDRLAALAKTAGSSSVDDALNALASRHDRILKETPSFLQNARFSVTFGRRFNYYDGFVFEISDPDGDPARPFGAGGRYDRLLAKLSNKDVDTSAIGGVVRPDRLPAGVSQP